MRRLMINGRPTGKNVDHSLIRDSMGFFEKTVFSVFSNALDPIQVSVNFIPNLLKEHQSTGFSCWNDTPFNPTRFTVELDSDLDYKTAIITTAHEFTHIKQYAMGERQ